MIAVVGEMIYPCCPMALTRPSGYPMVEDESAPVREEVAVIDGRGRLYMQRRWTQRISWWPSNPTELFSVLMIFAEPGLLSLRDWVANSAGIAERYAELAELDEEDAREAMRLIQDRYRRLPVDKGRRAHIGDAGLAHLGFPLDRAKNTVYVALFADRIDVFSANYRDSKLVESSSWIEDLP